MHVLTRDEVGEVSGGFIQVSSALGHLGRAFAIGYAIGSVIDAMARVGDSSGDSPFQYGA